MSYKEALFFIGKCLTLDFEEQNKIIVEKKLKSGNIDWDSIVKLSTSHFVFPALYCNLKRAKFLHYLPAELVNYMIYITDLNRERNEQIIAQAKEINSLLLLNNITPIFLKGTGNLLEGLYYDIGERMVGDIDFLVHENQLINTNKLLMKNGYKANKSGLYSDHRHLPRLVKKDRIAAVEIHKELLNKKNAIHFGFKNVNTSLLTIKKVNFLSYQNQLIYTILAKQVNDDGKVLNDISLKTSYDSLLLSNLTKTENAINSIPFFFKHINSYLNVSAFILNYPKSIKFEEKKYSVEKLTSFKYLLENIKYANFRFRVLSFYLFINKRLKIVLNAFFNGTDRRFILRRIFSLKYYKEKLKLNA